MDEKTKFDIIFDRYLHTLRRSVDINRFDFASPNWPIEPTSLDEEKDLLSLRAFDRPSLDGKRVLLVVVIDKPIKSEDSSIEGSSRIHVRSEYWENGKERLESAWAVNLPYEEDAWKPYQLYHYASRAHLLSPHCLPRGNAVSISESLECLRVGRMLLSLNPATKDGGFRSVDLPSTYWEELVSNERYIIVSRRRVPRLEMVNSSATEDHGSLMRSTSPDEDKLDNLHHTREIQPMDSGSQLFSDLLWPSPDCDKLSFQTHVNVQCEMRTSMTQFDTALATLESEFNSLLSQKSAGSRTPSGGEHKANKFSKSAKPSSCSFCLRSIDCRYSCRICSSGSYGLCDACFNKGAWCNSIEHRLGDTLHPKEIDDDYVGYTDLRFHQDLVVYDIQTDQDEPLFRFSSGEGSHLCNSPAVIHASGKFFVWPTDSDMLFIASINGASKFPKKLGASNQAYLVIQTSLRFSTCSEYLHVVRFQTPTIETYRRLKIRPWQGQYDFCVQEDNRCDLIVCISTFRVHLRAGMYHDLEPVYAQTVDLGACGAECIAELLFDISWMLGYISISLNDTRLKLFCLELFPVELALAYKDPGMLAINHFFESLGLAFPQSELGHHQQGKDSRSSIGAELVSTVLIPKFVEGRGVRFFLVGPETSHCATLYVSSKTLAFASPPLEIRLSKKDICLWSNVRTGRRQRLSDADCVLSQPPGNLTDLHIWHRSFHVPLTLQATEEPPNRFSTECGRLSVIFAEQLLCQPDTRCGQPTATWEYRPRLEDSNTLKHPPPRRSKNKRMFEFNAEIREGSGPPPAPREEGVQVLHNRHEIFEYSIQDERGKAWRRHKLFDIYNLDPSTLCNSCYQVDLALDDFIVVPSSDVRWQATPERDPQDIAPPAEADDSEVAYTCNVCHSAIAYEDPSWYCGICGDNQFDLCFTCRSEGKTCHDPTHELYPNNAEYDGFDDDGQAARLDPKPLMHAAPNELRLKVDCSLCRLLLHSWDATISPTRKATFADSMLGISFTTYGCHQLTKGRQGRYLSVSVSEAHTTIYLMLADKSVPIAGLSEIFGHCLRSDDDATSLLHNWLSRCETSHGRSCVRLLHGAPTDLLELRLIDCRDRCIISRQLPCRYLTLSYVWGQVKQPNVLCQGSIEQLEKPRSLDSHWATLPRTIKDAIEAVNNIGERYLWVDALSIVQDDPESRGRLIDNMHKIYSNSILCLVAAAGMDADAGLPGIRGQSFHRAQLEEELYEGFTLVALPNLQAGLSESRYSTRGWTLQEFLLSRRKVYFLKEGIYFQCLRRTCREDFAPTRPGVVSSLEVGRYSGHSSVRSYLATSWEIFAGPGSKFQELVEAYHYRQLGHDQDILRAFRGLMNLFKEEHKLGYIDGLPLSFLDASLLWAPLRYAWRRKPFASFCWSGWKRPNDQSAPEIVWPSSISKGPCRHPFITFPVMSSGDWFLQDTYIAWHWAFGPERPKLLRNVYSWIISTCGPIQPRAAGNGQYGFEYDLLGRPINWKWRTKYNAQGRIVRRVNAISRDPELISPWETYQIPSEVDRYDVGGENPQLPQSRAFLHFWAITCTFLLGDDSVKVDPSFTPRGGADNLRLKSLSGGHFRFKSLRCERGWIHGHVAISDFWQPLDPKVKLIVLSNNVHPQFGGNIISLQDEHEVPGAEGIKEKTVLNVMLVESHGTFFEKVGTGVLSRHALECSLECSPKWEKIILG